MSAPRRTFSNYDEEAEKYRQAQAEYKQIVEQYSGENAYQKIKADSTAAANQAAGSRAQQFSAQQYANAMAAGESRANAIRLMNSGLSEAMGEAYNSQFDRNAQIQSNAYANALTGAQGSLQSQANLVNWANQKDEAKYQSESNRYGSAMGALGGAFTGFANAL